MPLPTRPPEWGMMRSPLFRMAATTATLVPCHSSRRCSSSSWALKRSSCRDADIQAVHRGTHGCTGWRIATHLPRPAPVPGWRGRRVGACSALASWAECAPGWSSPKAIPECNHGFPTVTWENHLLLTSPSRATCQMLRIWSLCPVCIT